MFLEKTSYHLIFFIVLGVYGDVQRVKILFNKKDNALIQYAEPAQAQLGMQATASDFSGVLMNTEYCKIDGIFGIIIFMRLGVKI